MKRYEAAAYLCAAAGFLLNVFGGLSKDPSWFFIVVAMPFAGGMVGFMYADSSERDRLEAEKVDRALGDNE